MMGWGLRLEVLGGRVNGRGDVDVKLFSSTLGVYGVRVEVGNIKRGMDS